MIRTQITAICAGIMWVSGAAGAQSAVSTIPAALTLDAAIALAFQNHGNVSAARQGLDASRARLAASRSNLLPQVSASVNSDYAKSSSLTGGSSYSTATQTNLSLSQTIFDGGGLRAQVKRSQAGADSSRAGIGSARQNLAYQVARNFYEQLRDEHLIIQRREQAGLAQGQLAQIEAQVAAGTAARVDAQSVRVTLSQAQFNLTAAQNALKTAQVNLRDSLGLARGAPLALIENPDVAALSDSFAALPTDGADSARIAPLQVPELAPMESYLQAAPTRRPDLAGDRASVQSSEAALSIARAANSPQLSGTAGYNLRNLANSGRGFTAGLSVSLPVFDAGGRRADVVAAQNDLAASRTRLSQLERDVAADVEASYVSVSGALQSIQNARALVASARANLAAATERYRAGVGIVLDVVNAQTSLAEAQTSATGAIYDYQTALADLSRASGAFAP